MGIPNLLPKLQSVTTALHVREYAGKKAAVDTYSWMHKAAFNCSKDICEGRPTQAFVDYCMRRVNLLRHFGVEPILVFDGGMLPMKADQEAKRARSRKENLERALEHERSGNHNAADLCYKKAVDITPALAFSLIKVLQQNNVRYVVAPYEADAQMAFLAFRDYVDVVITEDSDMIAYGCPKVFFKMDKDGNGVEFQYCDLVKNKDLDFTNFTRQMVLEMCIMSGCDYLPSLSGLGVIRAHGFIKRMKSYKKVINHMRLTGVQIPKTYEEHFGKSVLTFNHQRVFDPESQEIVHLKEVPKDVELDLDFVGPYIPTPLARLIAIGEIDPFSKQPFTQNAYQFRQVVQKAKGDPPQRNLLTQYFSKQQPSAHERWRNLSPLRVDDSTRPFSPAIRAADFPDDLDLSEPPEKTFEPYWQLDHSRIADHRLEDLNFESTHQDPSVSPSICTPKSESSSSSCLIDGSHDFKERRLDLKALPVRRSRYFSRRANQDDDYLKPGCDNEREASSELQPQQEEKGNVQNTNAALFASVKRKYVPVFNSTLLGDGMSKRSFATEISHVEHYESLAQQSMEKFISAITPFKRSYAGARPSGLRPFRKANDGIPQKRNGDTEFSNTELSTFAHPAKTFRAPRSVDLQPSAAAAAAALWRD